MNVWITLCLTLFLVACRSAASSDFSAHWGLMAGFGGSQFDLKAHPPQPTTASSNLFAILAGSVTPTAQPGSAGGLALDASLSWKRIIDLRGEWWWALRDAKVEEDLGSGTKRNTDYVREVAEGDLLLRLGWPIRFGNRNYLRPLIESGVFGNRTLNARKEIGITGETSTAVKTWEGVPNEDWGYACGAGLEWSTPEVAPGLEIRYYEGQKDLDPKGVNELKSRSWMIILFLGF